MSGNRQSYFDVLDATAYAIHYSRGQRTWTNRRGQKYLRGILIMRGINVEYIVYDTVERMDGTPWLRPGLYKAAMEESVDERNPGRRQIRPSHTQRNSEGRICNFLIHASSPPHFLTGCIAPGYESAEGLAQSSEALETIFLSLGGFEPGKQVHLNISGSMPAN